MEDGHSQFCDSEEAESKRPRKTGRLSRIAENTQSSYSRRPWHLQGHPSAKVQETSANASFNIKPAKAVTASFSRECFPRLCHEAEDMVRETGCGRSRERRAVFLSDSEGDDAAAGVGERVHGAAAAKKSRSRKRKTQNKQTSGMLGVRGAKVAASAACNPRGSGARTSCGEDEEDKPLSLFGMGLLNRLDQQTKARRKRAPVGLCHKGSLQCASAYKVSCLEDDDTLDIHGREGSSARNMAFGGVVGAKGYAFDPECIYNFADTRASHCFPRQSALGACQGILDAISKCNVHEGLNSSAEKWLDNGTTASDGRQEEVQDVTTQMVINLDHILSCTPYKDMLQDLFRHHTAQSSSSHESCGSDKNRQGAWVGSSTAASSIPVVPKSYEESFMREPMWDYERPCAMGASCECNFISTRPGEGFTAVEFLLPSEDKTQRQCDSGASAHEDRSPRRTCVLCHRKLVQSRFYDIIYSGMPFRGVIQRYGNICNHAGEYAREVMLICPPNGPVECMPFPSVSHQRNKYSVYTKGGIRYIKQNKLSWEDFCQAPPSSAVP